MTPTLRRYVNADPCRCLDPDVALGAYRCDGRTRDFLYARFLRMPRERCLRCDRSRRSVSQRGLCVECLGALGRLAEAARAAWSPHESSTGRACAWCGVAADDLVGRDGIYVCDACARCASSWRRGDPPAGAIPSVACSFCARVPTVAGMIAGPKVFLCARCFEHARKLRRRDQRDPIDRHDRTCSFDGKGFRELREIYGPDGGPSFCDECVALIDDVLREQSVAAALALRESDPDDACGWCGGERPDVELVRAARGPALCRRCLVEPPCVGRWCDRCARPAWRTRGVLEVGPEAWCVDCVRTEARLAALLRAAGA